MDRDCQKRQAVAATKTMQFRLRPGERLFVNGAALKFDRKVMVEFLNDVTFLLEAHVLPPESATTALKQLYFVIQLTMIEPDKKALRWALVEKALADAVAMYRDSELAGGLLQVQRLVEAERCFDALKILRGLFDAEAELLKMDSAFRLNGSGEGVLTASLSGKA